MTRRFFCRQYSLLALTALFCCTGSALAQQQQLGNKEDTERPFNDKHKTRFEKLRDAEVQVDAAKDKELLDVSARYFVHRLTWSTLQNDKSPDGGIAGLQKRFAESIVVPATASGKNKEFMRLWSKELITRLKEVLGLDIKTYHHAVTNAALMLQTLAKNRQEEVQDFLLDMSRADKDNKPVVHPFIRMCAVRALGEFSAPHWSKVDDQTEETKILAKRKRDLDRLDWMAKFVAQPYPPDGDTPEHKDAMSYVRREGIKALAHVQVPAYGIDKKKGEVVGPAGYYLLYIASGGSFPVGPPLSLSERLEATIGLCQLKVTETPEYNVDLGVYVVANNLAAMASDYLNDWVYFSFKDTTSKEAPKRLSKLPWQTYAMHLEVALEAMSANVPKDLPAAKKVQTLRSNMDKLLEKMKKRAQIEPPAELVQFAESIRPASFDAYPGFKGFEVPQYKK